MSSPLTFGRRWLLNTGNLSRLVSTVQNKFSVLAIKNVLIGGAGNGSGWTNQAGAAVAAPAIWTVYYSSNGTAPGTGVAGDGVDHWVAYTDILWGSVAGANSWMVLYNATAGIYWLISCENAASDSNTLDMWVSTDAFVGGTSTARPTAPSEFNMLASAVWGSGGDAAIRFHVLMSDDGAATRVFTNYNTTMKGAWFVETMLDVSAGVQGNLFAAAYAKTGTNALDLNGLSQFAQIVGRTTGGKPIWGVLAGEGSRYAGNIQNGLSAVERTLWNDIAATNQAAPVGVMGTLATGARVTRGHVGSLVDLWWGSDFLSCGMSFPSGYERQIITQGPLLIPWNTLLPRVF